MSDPTVQVAFFILAFEGIRTDIIEIIEDIGDVQSVDKLVVENEVEGDPLTVTVILDLTSEYSTTEFRSDQAWEITNLVSILYTPDEGVWYGSAWNPGFDLTVSGLNYRCTGDFMVDLADSRKSQGDWLAECA